MSIISAMMGNASNPELFHSKLPPSSAARRMACPGSRSMESHYGRNTESESSAEGTLAHELAAAYLRGPTGGIQADKYTKEMHSGAKYYADTVRHYAEDNYLRIEQRVDISNVHPDMWGTPDLSFVKDNALHVFDYKFGFLPVEAYENWQLLAYACGIMNDPVNTPIGTVYLHIVQPRDYVSSSHHKVWVLDTYAFENYKNRLMISEALSMTPQAELKVSEQCKYCSARYACPALRSAAFGAAEVSYRSTEPLVDPSNLGIELKFLHEARELLDYRITALETEVQHLLQAGKNVINYELVPTSGRLSWNVDAKEVLNLGLVLGFDLRKDDVLTPTQAIKAGMSEDTVLQYSERKQSLKLTKVDLKRSKAAFKQQ